MVESLNKMNQELITLVESTSSSKEKPIEEKKKRVRKLVDLLEKSVGNSEICIVKKDKTTVKKDNKIVEFQSLL